MVNVTIKNDGVVVPLCVFELSAVGEMRGKQVFYFTCTFLPHLCFSS
jgi:hypothetical protein